MVLRRFIALGSVAGLLLALDACTTINTSSTPPLARPTLPPPSNRGKIDALKQVVTITRAEIRADANSAIISAIGGPPKCDVILYAIAYETIGVKGEPANASAAMFVPKPGCGTGPFPLVGYAHGTNVVRSQLITNPKTSDPKFTAPDQLPVVIAAILASHGYVVAATDYLGLGLSRYPYHPYLHDDSEASAVVDSLRAARTAAKTLNLQLSGKVMITGHSQGGQAALATQRAIESQNAGEFNLVGDAPSSGPYDLTQTFLDSIVHPSQDAPILATYVLTGYQKTYGNIYSSPTDIFQLPWANGIDSLLPVPTLADQEELFGTKLPLQLSQLLQPSFTTSFTSDPNSPARVDTAANDLLSAWKPAAPIFLCGGSRDPEVEFKNAQAALSYFTSVGANVTLTDVDSLMPPSLPIQDYHVTVADFCLTLARVKFFDTLRAGSHQRR